MLSMIVAVSDNNVIGQNGGIPWHLPGDFARFKILTKNADWYVTGRKSYESLLLTLKDKTQEPLPGRNKLIFTKNLDFNAPHCAVTTILTPILLAAETKNVFIGGGAEIYKLFLPFADRLYLTRVHKIVEGDAYFPALNPDEWERFYCPIDAIIERHPKDECDYEFTDYQRRTHD